MMQERGTVIEYKNHQAQIEVAIKTTCSGCQANQECGTGVVARSLNPKSQRFWVPVSGPLKQGQQVVLGIPEARILTASLLIYLVPLLVATCTALIMQVWMAEPVVIALSILSAALSYLPIRQFFKRHEAQYQPQLLKVLPVAVETQIHQTLS